MCLIGSAAGQLHLRRYCGVSRNCSTRLRNAALLPILLFLHFAHRCVRSSQELYLSEPVKSYPRQARQAQPHPLV